MGFGLSQLIYQGGFVEAAEMRLGLQRYSYRLAEKTPSSKLALKQQIEDVLLDLGIEIASLSQPHFNEGL